jgi:hypothetical protein
VRNRDLLAAAPQELLDAYPGFYVIPFSSLRSADGAT